MKYLILLSFAICLSFSVQSQQSENIPDAPLSILSLQEEEGLKALPFLSLPESYKNRSLPVFVDNSTQPYMRSAFQQSGLCCGQAAGIGYNYTYEIDRLRNLPANINDNLYPTHFTWNWMHGGNGWYGVSYLHSFEILRHCGNVNVTEYGGSLSAGGSERWMTGYNNYLAGMDNRINEVYQINVGTPEGLDIFKHWINDHLEEAAVGGVGSFYSQYMSVNSTLPAGTPEAGKHVLTYFSGSANHAQTIVGYHDSICWDYNSDGQYTNHIDINNDGEVNMKDWEIGGFKMVQSYGGVPGWGDQGFAYMMYKTVADKLGGGGIWNHCVHVLRAKENCSPQATMKIRLTHSSREKIKVVAGLSNDVNATAPQHILEFPILNYQGGDQYMQGGTSNPDNKTIEFGLDISPLLGEIELNQDVKFFLQVYEYDPNGQGTGTIDHFSVFDYTIGANEIVCPQSNVPITENDLTTLSLIANFSFDRVHIVNTNLPPAIIGQPYSFQLQASGGNQPYRFHLKKEYPESNSSEPFPAITQNQLSPGNSSSGFVSQALDFDFPYYDSSYSSVTVHVDGYLMFDEQLFPYPYFYDDMNLFRITRNISPFMCHGIRLYAGDGIWYEGDTTQATFRWKASINGNAGGTDINVAVRLFPSGDIEFFYGDIQIGDEDIWVPGFCDGNEHELQFSSFYFSGLPAPNTKFSYARYNYPEGISISEDGLISGTVQQSVNGETLTVKVTDNNFVYDHQSMVFSTSGIMISDSIAAGGDEVIEYSEMVNQSVTLTNLEANPISDASISIVINDTNIIMVDDNEYIGNLAVGESITLLNAFSFLIEPDVPNEHLLEIETSIDGVRWVWENTLTHLAYAPEILIHDIIVDDGNNGRLDPGETCDLVINIKNEGGSNASGLNCLLQCSDPNITINQNVVALGELAPDSSATLIYNVSIDAGAVIGHVLEFDLAIDADMDFSINLPFNLRIGLTVEDFETGDFKLFSWGFKGNRDWDVVGQNTFEGEFSARSGNITHQQSTSMILDIDVLDAGDLSFFRKVSCENGANDNYDYLSFYINDVEAARWDSILDWQEVSYPLSTGYHRLEWRYTKDTTVSVGLDAAFIDYISFPSCLDALPHLSVLPEELDKGMFPDTQDTDTIMISNTGEGEIEFEILIYSQTKKSESGNRSIAGSTLECDQSEFLSGEAFTWSFELYNNSDDNEWIKELSIQIPDGITIESTSNFSGGSGGDLVFNGSFGNGPLLYWFGEDASGWGVVHQGEFAYGEISGYVESGFSGDAILDFIIYGEGYAAEPHIVEGEITLNNLGNIVSWISCDHYDGGVLGQSNHDLMVTFNTDGLSDGHYYCNILMSDNFQNETIIPVHLLVDTYLGTEQINEVSDNIEVFPNPFNELIHINYSCQSSETINMRIVDAYGRIRGTITEQYHAKAGNQRFNWDASGLESGVYFIIAESEHKRSVQKVIKVKNTK